MEIESLDCPGCFLIKPKVIKDNRGCFVKTLHNSTFGKNGIRFDLKEEYYSVSKKNVIRGMHFQCPPFEHEKYVYCISGAVLDVFVDLRKGSPTYKQTFSYELNDENCFALFLPKGIAHGFLTTSEKAVMVYKTSTEYEPKADDGILWNSINFKWPIESPIISERDSSFKSLGEFDSKFFYKEEV